MPVQKAQSKTFSVSMLLDDYCEIVNAYEGKIGKLDSYARLLKSLEHVELAHELSFFFNIDTQFEAYLDALKLTALERLNTRFQNSSAEYLPAFTQAMTLTNDFYCALVGILFGVDNLAALIQIFSDDSVPAWQQVIIDIPSTCPDGLSVKEKMRFFEHTKRLSITLGGYENLATQPATLTALSSYVFSSVERVMLNLNTINRYSFARQRYIYKMLHAHYPDLAKRVYEHNEAWRFLASDIQEVEKAGITPKKALQRLIKGLRRGGEHYSDNADEGNETALNAVTQFTLYFDSLPIELQNQLMQLETKDGKIKFSDTLAGLNITQCVETMAHHLEALLNSNEGKQCLAVLVGLSPAYLSLIEEKCRHGLAVSQSTDILHCEIPEALGKAVLKYLDVTDEMKLFDKLFCFPNVLLNLFWQTFEVEDESNFLLNVFSYMAIDGVIGERKDCMFSAIFDNIRTFSDVTQQAIYAYFIDRLHQQITTKSAMLPFLTLAQLMRVLTLKSTLPRDFENPLIHELVNVHPECLMVMLDTMKDNALYCELIGIEVAVDGARIPVLFQLALCWAGHFDRLMSRLEQDESLSAYKPTIKALFKQDCIDAVLDTMLVKHPNNYLASVDLFKHTIQKWIDERPVYEEESRVFKFH